MMKHKLYDISRLLKETHIAVPVLLLCVLAMVILPLSPLVLDILFTFNIVMAVLVLLVSVNSKRPLDFQFTADITDRYADAFNLKRRLHTRGITQWS